MFMGIFVIAIKWKMKNHTSRPLKYTFFGDIIEPLEGSFLGIYSTFIVAIWGLVLSLIK